LDEIDRGMLGEFISRRKRAGTMDATIRGDLAFLSSLCAAAVRWGWLGTNPVTALNKITLKTSRPRTRFLTPAELDQLLAATVDHIRPAIIIATEPGLRKEELFSLTLSGIDLTRREIRLDHTKSGIPRRAPLSDKAVTTIKAILHQPQRPNSAYLFAKADDGRYVDMKNGFVAACKRAGLTDFRWHDLRHTFASWFVQDGGEGHATYRDDRPIWPPSGPAISILSFGGWHKTGHRSMKFATHRRSAIPRYDPKMRNGGDCSPPPVSSSPS
jgi:integrase/recombinase XerD